jgi:hypothetical protein
MLSVLDAAVLAEVIARGLEHAFLRGKTAG